MQFANADATGLTKNRLKELSKKGTTIQRLTMQYFMLLKKAPWWLFAIVAVLFFVAAETLFRVGASMNEDRKTALSQDAPTPIDLTNFSWKEDRSLANEVTVTGWIDWDNTVRLIDVKKSGEIKAERTAYFLFGAGDTPQDRQVRAIMLLDEAAEDHFMVNEGSYLLSKPTDVSDLLTYQFNGLAMKSAKLGSNAKDALEDRGLSMSKEMIFIEPFFEGRSVGLAPIKNLAAGRILIHGMGGVILLVSALVFFIRRRKKTVVDLPDTAPLTDTVIRPDALIIADIPVPAAMSEDVDDRPSGWLSNLLTKDMVLNALGTFLVLLVVVIPSWLSVLLPLGGLLWAYANVEKVKTTIDGLIETARETVQGKPKLPDKDPFDRVGN